MIKAIKEYLISASWHSTNKVVGRYKATFDINVQKEWPIDEIEIATQKRNHLVHRGGKDKEGNSVVITEQDLDMLLDHAQSLGEKLFDSLGVALQKKMRANFESRVWLVVLPIKSKKLIRGRQCLPEDYFLLPN
ncbi:Uncharacterised protein [Klebsiella michiganensis]|uniref:RiboL-PSP-HEPN domain-containing protein n=1 Tax=Klebsiella michiganensis TaxID=1134687 RepID=A0A7H4N6P0_9ENTR|nr:Uncharacterised protein [Klebsiella michiganensis]